jgi:hypothetical protein
MQLSGTTIEEVNSSCEIGAFSSLLLLQLMACTIRKKFRRAYQYLRLRYILVVLIVQVQLLCSLDPQLILHRKNV